MRTLVASTVMAVLLAATPAGAQTGQFCLKTMDGKANCSFQSMAQCEQARSAGSADQCVDRALIGGGTTGSGGNMPTTPGGTNR